MNKNLSGNLSGLYLVILIVASSLLGNNALAVEPASAAANLELMNQAISHSEEAVKSANAGEVDQTLEHIQMALDSTDEIEVANAAAMQRAAGRLKTARRNLKKGEPIEKSLGDLEEAVKSLKELKANSL
jgi:hypothetical protein